MLKKRYNNFRNVNMNFFCRKQIHHVYNSDNVRILIKNVVLINQYIHLQYM